VAHAPKKVPRHHSRCSVSLHTLRCTWLDGMGCFSVPACACTTCGVWLLLHCCGWASHIMPCWVMLPLDFPTSGNAIHTGVTLAPS
jgi:hypothetical protein